MRAALFQGAHLPMAIDTVADPICGPDDVILKVAYSGIYGTDLHVTEGDDPFVQPGTIMARWPTARPH
ncbi:MAG: hypothetical protein QHC40_01225 [Sphingobium sp.]|nr:hypothetical protein [Sphingobium sp.]